MRTAPEKVLLCYRPVHTRPAVLFPNAGAGRSVQEYPSPHGNEMHLQTGSVIARKIPMYSTNALMSWHNLPDGRSIAGGGKSVHESPDIQGKSTQLIGTWVGLLEPVILQTNAFMFEHTRPAVELAPPVMSEQ